MISQNLKFRRHHLLTKSDCPPSPPPLCKAQSIKYYVFTPQLSSVTGGDYTTAVPQRSIIHVSKEDRGTVAPGPLRWKRTDREMLFQHTPQAKSTFSIGKAAFFCLKLYFFITWWHSAFISSSGKMILGILYFKAGRNYFNVGRIFYEN